jgi:hypothetical protein
MKTYDYVEDYLEVIAGKVDINLKSTAAHGWFVSFHPIINLARYDTNFLDNVTDATINGSALTDKQAELAIKLISKYHRQLAAHQINIGDMTMPRYRKPLRIIDRNKSASVQDGKIVLKFPYNSDYIESIRAMGKLSQGKVRFDREAKVWKLALTEYNVNWACEFARTHEFEVDDQLIDFMTRIIETEKEDYSICLHQLDGEYGIKNSSESLCSYVQEQLNGFALDNRTQLVDYSSVLGYSVDADILQEVEQDLGPSTFLLCTNREYDFNSVTDYVSRIAKYAQAVNRFPIVVFNPTPDEALDEWQKYFASEEILVVGNKKEAVIESHHRVVYSVRPMDHMNSIPLLVTHVGMMIGANKQLMASRAEKVFYTALKLKS